MRVHTSNNRSKGRLGSKLRSCEFPFPFPFAFDFALLVEIACLTRFRGRLVVSKSSISGIQRQPAVCLPLDDRFPWVSLPSSTLISFNSGSLSAGVFAKWRAGESRCSGAAEGVDAGIVTSILSGKLQKKTVRCSLRGVEGNVKCGCGSRPTIQFL